MTPQEYDAIHALRSDVSMLRTEVNGQLSEIRQALDKRDERLRRVEQVAATTKVLATSGLVLFGTIFGGVLYIVK